MQLIYLDQYFCIIFPSNIYPHLLHWLNSYKYFQFIFPLYFSFLQESFLFQLYRSVLPTYYSIIVLSCPFAIIPILLLSISSTSKSTWGIERVLFFFFLKPWQSGLIYLFHFLAPFFLPKFIHSYYIGWMVKIILMSFFHCIFRFCHSLFFLIVSILFHPASIR